MSPMLMTDSWATEVRSCPWPQCVKLVPQDKQHSWHTLHSIRSSIFVRDVTFPLAMKQCRCGARSTPFYESAVLGVYARAGSGSEISKNGCGHMYGSARGRQILQYKINPNPNPNPNTNPSSPYCIMRFIFGSRVHVPSRVKMAVGRERKTGNVMISPQEH